MKHIVEIRRLENDIGQFGYVGMEIETGKIRYFTNYDELGIYNRDKLFEFDINNIKNENLRILISSCEYRRERVCSLYPDEINSEIEVAMKKHIKFNKEKNFPLKYFKKNLKNLAWESFEGSRVIGSYIPVENIIRIGVTKKLWEKSNEQERKEYLSTPLHEIGHMKVARYKFDKNNFTIEVNSGFYNIKHSYLPLFKTKDGIFLKHHEEILSYKSDRELILEEIMNEYECRLINPNYHPVYPDVGYLLNYLCDDRLLKARYTNGITEYYDSLTKIINNEKKAEELLDSLVYEYKEHRDISNSLKLIKEYRDVIKRGR